MNIRLDNYGQLATGGYVTWFDDVVLKKTNFTSEILEENNYYAFGMKHEGYNTIINSTNPALKYKYNGKELQDELNLNLYDYGARNYDPALGRWMNIDPLAEISRRWSPYNYAYNNPVYFIDPDGMLAEGFFDNKASSYIDQMKQMTDIGSVDGAETSDPLITSKNDYSLTYNGKNKYTLTAVRTTIQKQYEGNRFTTTTLTTTTTTNVNYTMSEDKDGNAVMTITSGSTNKLSTQRIIVNSGENMSLGMNISEKTIIDYTKQMDSKNPNSILDGDRNLPAIVKGIQAYHQVNGAYHNIFMDPKNSDIDPITSASGGIVQEIIKSFTPGRGIRGGGLLSAILGFIPAAVDRYYAGDRERSIGRTATIVPAN